jgi:hypothetical protein
MLALQVAGSDPPTFAIYRPATGRSRQIMSQQVGESATFRGFPAPVWCLQYLYAVHWAGTPPL